MKPSSRLKTAFLAAASFTAVSAAVVSAAEAPPMAPVAIGHAVTAVDMGKERAATVITVKNAGLAALGAAALAGLARFIGFARIKSAVAASAAAAGKAASASLAATASAAAAVGRAVASPFRFAALLAGLAIVALTGVGLYDIEWAGGLVFGAVLAATLIFAAGKLRKTLVSARLGRSR